MVCGSMWWYVLVCGGMWYGMWWYVVVFGGMWWYVAVCAGMWWYVVKSVTPLGIISFEEIFKCVVSIFTIL